MPTRKTIRRIIQASKLQAASKRLSNICVRNFLTQKFFCYGAFLMVNIPASTLRDRALNRASEIAMKLADGKHVFFWDVNHAFLNLDGTLNQELLPDLLHPNPEGAKRWAQAMEPMLSQLLGDKSRDTEPALQYRDCSNAKARTRLLRLVCPPCRCATCQTKNESGNRPDRRLDYAFLGRRTKGQSCQRPQGMANGIR